MSIETFEFDKFTKFLPHDTLVYLLLTIGIANLFKLLVLSRSLLVKVINHMHIVSCEERHKYEGFLFGSSYNKGKYFKFSVCWCLS